MSDVPRLTITPRTVDAQEVASIVSLVQLDRVSEAWDRFQHASVGDGALARLGGVINAELAVQNQPPTIPSGAQRLDIPWGDGRRYPVTIGDDPLYVPIVVPADAVPLAVDGFASVYEFMGDPALREVSLSRYPCDFRPRGSAGLLLDGGGPLAAITINVGAGVAIGEVAYLAPGQTYYFNVRNHERDGTLRPSAVEIRWPHA
jgi:hypothetical protein